MPSAERAFRPARWPVSVTLVLALAAAFAGLGVAFTDESWWLPAVFVAALVTVAMGVVRARSWFALAPTLAGILGLLVLLTFSFAPRQAYVLFVPNLEVFGAFNQLWEQGVESITDQAIPADPTQGILFMLVIGSGVLAILFDFLAITVRRPALVGVPLLVLLLVPTFFDPTLGDAFFFFLTAAAYLLVLYMGLGEPRTGGAIAVGAGAVALALALPLALPPLDDQHEEGDGDGTFSVGVSAFVTLGDNLRRDRVRRVLTYVTDSEDGEYLSLSVISKFEGGKWSPKDPATREDSAINNIGAIPGLTAPGVATESVTTDIEVTNMGGHWLPAPYAPRKVTGADKNWSYDATTLTIDSPSESARGEVYTVESATPAPTLAQLRAAGNEVGPGLGDYLQLPRLLPGSIEDAAREVTAGADTNIDKAIALQSYFTGGEFEYSEIAPVEEDYDGTSAGIIEKFLEVKKGYCVHFSSAMAVMARVLGIPSRIVVGFAPGEFNEGDDGEPGFYSVTTENLHAWPELWFDGIGWVRFEPTPGRGTSPHFPADDDPSTPDDTPTSTPTGLPRETTAPTSSASFTPGPSASAGAQAAEPVNLTFARVTVGILVGAALLVLLLPLLPSAVRATRRARRYWRVHRRGSATEAWAELNDTAVDLGWSVTTSTPREFADLVRPRLKPAGVAALDRLQDAVEAEAYSRDSGRSALADVRLVRRAMWAATDRREHLRAIFSPASAIRRR